MLFSPCSTAGAEGELKTIDTTVVLYYQVGLRTAMVVVIVVPGNRSPTTAPHPLAEVSNDLEL